MPAFLDTSAVIPLLVEERHSVSAQKSWERFDEFYAWEWMRVEAEAALSRRKVGSETWNQWRKIEAMIGWLEPPVGWQERLCLFNRSLRLRAADAGHLYVMEQAGRVIDELTLVTFDEEMRAAAINLALSLWAEE
jgi:predicted nucleic acid-binding protein